MVLNLRVPWNFGKFLSSCSTGGLSRRAQLYGISLLWAYPEISQVLSQLLLSGDRCLFYSPCRTYSNASSAVMLSDCVYGRTFHTVNFSYILKSYEEPRYLSRCSDWLRLGRLGFDSRQGQVIFLHSIASRKNLVTIQPPAQWAPGDVSLRLKQPGREADNSPQSNTEVKNGGALSILPHTSS
jgi:hypothetical protein